MFLSNYKKVTNDYSRLTGKSFIAVNQGTKDLSLSLSTPPHFAIRLTIAFSILSISILWIQGY